MTNENDIKQEKQATLKVEIADSNGQIISPVAKAIRQKYVDELSSANFLSGRITGLDLLLKAAEKNEIEILLMQSTVVPLINDRLTAETKTLDKMKYISLDEDVFAIKLTEKIYSLPETKEKIPVPQDALNFTQDYVNALCASQFATGALVVLSDELLNVPNLAKQLESDPSDEAFKRGVADALDFYVKNNGNVSKKSFNTKMKNLTQEIENIDKKMQGTSDSDEKKKLFLSRQGFLGRVEGLKRGREIVKDFVNAATREKDNSRGLGE